MKSKKIFFKIKVMIMQKIKETLLSRKLSNKNLMMMRKLKEKKVKRNVRLNLLTRQHIKKLSFNTE